MIFFYVPKNGEKKLVHYVYVIISALSERNTPLSTLKTTRYSFSYL